MDGRTERVGSFHQTREGNFQFVGRVIRLTLQSVGQATEGYCQMFIKVLLSAAKRSVQLETGQLQAIFQQGNARYVEHTQLRLPGANGASPREILLTGRAEFEQLCVRERPDFIEGVVNRFP